MTNTVDVEDALLVLVEEIQEADKELHTTRTPANKLLANVKELIINGRLDEAVEVARQYVSLSGDRASQASRIWSKSMAMRNTLQTISPKS